ncbi:MAG: helix-turn-helix transcriptional regulator [Solirubrobacteraceae bacterium]|nr:helix-turn-helix transcriptional regulator [Solirubrobacteraceae bacterium]
MTTPDRVRAEPGQRLPELLRDMRENNEMSARQIAELAGIAHSHLGRLQRGETVPNERTIRRLTDALNYNPEAVLIVAGHTTGDDARRVLAEIVDSEQTTTFVMWDELIGYTHEQAETLLKDPDATDEQLVDLAYELALWGLGPRERKAERDLIADADQILSFWSRLAEQDDKDRIVAFARRVLELRELEREVILTATAATPTVAALSAEDLKRRGFEGFIPLARVRENASLLPKQPGVYVVLRATDAAPAFLERSVGGPYRDELPASIDELAARWTDETPLVYIGKSDRPLSKRVRELARYGAGHKEAHVGGRYMWQLADHADLLVAWIITDQPVSLEAELIAEFEHARGRLPFANIQRPKGAQR